MSHYPSSAAAAPGAEPPDAKGEAEGPDSAPGGLSDALVSAYLAAAIDSVHSLLGLAPSSPWSPVKPRWIGEGGARTAADDLDGWRSERRDRARPTLVLMSDDGEGAVRAFRQHPLGGSFRIVGTLEGEGEASLTLTADEEAEGDVPDQATREAEDLVRRARAPIPPGFVRPPDPRLLCSTPGP